jgi:thiol:disulfide interchange protein
MRRASIVALVMIASVGALVLSACLRQSHEAVPWRTDFQAASAEARQSNKPMLLDFTADWCGPCQEMRRTTWSDPHVAEVLKNYIPVQINIDDHADLANQFTVHGIPHLALLNSQGDVVRSSEGLLSSEDFLAWLSAH